MPKKDGLTPKQAAFVQEYLIDLNATQAAIRAGYSDKSASRIAMELLNKTHVSCAIQTALKERVKRTKITVDYVLKGFKDVAERCMQREAVLDHEGNETGEQHKFLSDETVVVDYENGNVATVLIHINHRYAFIKQAAVKNIVAARP